jgi:hypothetical protein
LNYALIIPLHRLTDEGVKDNLSLLFVVEDHLTTPFLAGYIS